MPPAYELVHVLAVSQLCTVWVAYMVHCWDTDHFMLLACVHWLQRDRGKYFTPFSLICELPKPCKVEVECSIMFFAD